jgi:hypothetical protein
LNLPAATWQLDKRCAVERCSVLLVVVENPPLLLAACLCLHCVILQMLQATILVKFNPPPGAGDSVGRWIEGR